MIEFLYQKGFINGKKWREYIDELAEKGVPVHFLRYAPLIDAFHPPMEEGKIPPQTMV